ncbi:transposase DNA-binding-containing protein [Candidatus Regiella insecticola]|uniref:transposase DNA-binding-containing protein n=1 Tax=Candidatus Regiella insecticola TaxID=138073 RepID=UPI0003178CA2|nr:transposase DNA-binding-containing protein [Candidatus Regiella insecticola]
MKTVTGNGNEWVREEFHQIDFGDKRLKERFLKQRAYYHQKRQVQFTKAVMAPVHRPKVLIDLVGKSI